MNGTDYFVVGFVIGCCVTGVLGLLVTIYLTRNRS